MTLQSSGVRLLLMDLSKCQEDVGRVDSGLGHSTHSAGTSRGPASQPHQSLLIDISNNYKFIISSKNTNSPSNDEAEEEAAKVEKL